MKILGVNNYQTQKDSKINFGMRPISAEQAKVIGDALCQKVPGIFEPRPKITDFMENFSELKDVLTAIFKQNREQLLTAESKLDFVTKVVSNMTDWAYELGSQYQRKFLSGAEFDKEALVLNISSHIQTALAKSFEPKIP